MFEVPSIQELALIELIKGVCMCMCVCVHCMYMLNILKILGVLMKDPEERYNIPQIRTHQ